MPFHYGVIRVMQALLAQHIPRQICVDQATSIQTRRATRGGSRGHRVNRTSARANCTGPQSWDTPTTNFSSATCMCTCPCLQNSRGVDRILSSSVHEDLRLENRERGVVVSSQQFNCSRRLTGSFSHARGSEMQFPSLCHKNPFHTISHHFVSIHQ